MIRHVVFVKFRDDATKQEIATFIEEVNKLPHINREVKNWVTGTTPSPRFHSGDFDWALSCDLADAEAMDRYMSHEGHLRMTDFLSPVENMMSYDWEIEYVGPDQSDAPATVPEAAAAKRADGKVIVPEIRGKQLERARGMAAAAGLAIGEDMERILGSVWAPGRIVDCDPAPGTAVAPGTSLQVAVTGNWLCQPTQPEPAQLYGP